MQRLAAWAVPLSFAIGSLVFTGAAYGASPEITGIAQVGQLLTAVSADPQSGYTWTRDGITDVGSGATYRPTAFDAGHSLTVTATGAGGPSTSPAVTVEGRRGPSFTDPSTLVAPPPYPGSVGDVVTASDSTVFWTISVWGATPQSQVWSAPMVGTGAQAALGTRTMLAGGLSDAGALALSSTNRLLFVGDRLSHVVHVVGLGAQVSTATLDIGAAPYALAVAPDDSELYVEDNQGTEAFPMTETLGASGAWSVVLGQPTSVSTTNLGGILAMPDGRTLYAGDTRFSVEPGPTGPTFTEVDPGAVADGGQPVLGPDGTVYDVGDAFLYQLNPNHSGLGTLVSSGLDGNVAFSPDGATLFTATYSKGLESWRGHVGVTMPQITGDMRVGGTIAVDPDDGVPVDGPHDDLGATVSYQWLKFDYGTHTLSDIPGATQTEYTIQPTDAGKTIGLRVTLSRPGFEDGVATNLPVYIVPGVPNPSPDGTPAPPIVGAKPAPVVSSSGSPKIAIHHHQGANASKVAGRGDVLTADPAAWSPDDVSLAFQWWIGSKPIPGATTAHLRLTGKTYRRAHRHSVHVTVTGTAPLSAPLTQTSTSIHVS